MAIGMMPRTKKSKWRLPDMDAIKVSRKKSEPELMGKGSAVKCIIRDKRYEKHSENG